MRVTERDPPGDITDKGTSNSVILLPECLHNNSTKHTDIKESVAPESNNTLARKPSIRMVPSVTLSAAWASSAVTTKTLAGLVARPAETTASWFFHLGHSLLLCSTSPQLKHLPEALKHSVPAWCFPHKAQRGYRFATGIDPTS